MPRSLSEIAEDILVHWKRPYFGAVPYISAMRGLHSIQDDYGLDSAKSIVLYFLSNAATWRGADARRLKKELRGMLG